MADEAKTPESVAYEIRRGGTEEIEQGGLFVLAALEGLLLAYGQHEISKEGLCFGMRALRTVHLAKSPDPAGQTLQEMMLAGLDGFIAAVETNDKQGEN